MFKLEKHPNGYASLIGHGLQSQDARTATHAEGHRLVDTLNDLLDEIPQLRKRAQDLKALNEAADERIQGLQTLAVTDNQHLQRLLDAIEASQSVLAAYLLPGLPVTRKSMQKALSDLLGILDDGNLVMLCRELRSSEPADMPISPASPFKVLGIPNLNLWEEADAQITFDGGKHWTNVAVDGEYFIALSDGKRSWLRKDFQGDRVVYSVNASSIVKLIGASISEASLAPQVTDLRTPKPDWQEHTPLIVKPKTRRALVQAIEILEDSGTQSDAKAAKRLKKLLR